MINDIIVYKLRIKKVVQDKDKNKENPTEDYFGFTCCVSA